VVAVPRVVARVTDPSGPPEGVPADGSAPGGQTPDGLSFEELMDALEAITTRLAQGDLGIEMAADLYEQAERLHARASERLLQVQQRVARLAGERAGAPETGGGTGA
jgi:exodeoxyribonuclease VII small subunit